MHTQFRVSDDHKLRLMLKKQSAKVRVVDLVDRELTCKCGYYTCVRLWKYLFAIVGCCALCDHYGFLCLMILIKAEEKLKMERGEVPDQVVDSKGMLTAHVNIHVSK